MRVYHVVRQFWPSIGGLEDVVGHLAREQAARGLQVEIITLNRIFADPQRLLAEHEVVAGLEVTRLPYFGSSRYPIAAKILGAIGNADLVHVHAVDFFFDIFALTRGLHRKPLVATTHGGFFHTKAHARLKRIWFDQITRRSIKRYDAIVACSAADEELFAPIATDNLHRIDNGVAIDKFAGCSSPQRVKRLATIGRFSVNKRLDRLLDTLVHLVAIDPEWVLEIIGAPSDWSAARLAAEVAERGLTKHVHISAGASDAEAAARLAQTSFFVSASEHEGFGLAAVEALSAGLIPIVHANAAFLSLQARCPLIEIADYSDPATAAAKIESIWRDQAANYAARREAACASARQFAWPRVAELYIELYRKVLEACSSGRSPAAKPPSERF